MRLKVGVYVEVKAGFIEGCLNGSSRGWRVQLTEKMRERREKDKERERERKEVSE